MTRGQMNRDSRQCWSPAECAPATWPALLEGNAIRFGRRDGNAFVGHLVCAGGRRREAFPYRISSLGNSHTRFALQPSSRTTFPFHSFLIPMLFQTTSQLFSIFLKTNTKISTKVQKKFFLQKVLPHMYKLFYVFF